MNPAVFTDLSYYRTRRAGLTRKGELFDLKRKILIRLSDGTYARSNSYYTALKVILGQVNTQIASSTRDINKDYSVT